MSPADLLAAAVEAIDAAAAAARRGDARSALSHLKRARAYLRAAAAL